MDPPTNVSRYNNIHNRLGHALIDARVKVSRSARCSAKAARYSKNSIGSDGSCFNGALVRFIFGGGFDEGVWRRRKVYVYVFEEFLNGLRVARTTCWSSFENETIAFIPINNDSSTTPKARVGK